MIGYCFYFIISYTVMYESNSTKIQLGKTNDTYYIDDARAIIKSRECMSISLGEL